MIIDIKRTQEVVPSYSLTGDLLSFLRCGLQYRYHNGSSLPPSRPVQLWFGEFIHGVLEGAYRIWREQSPPFPWPSNPTVYRKVYSARRVDYDLGVIGDTVEESLRAQGKNPRSADARNSAYRRVELAVNELGPYLFPLISAAEEKVIGTRDVPDSAAPGTSFRANRYELHGIIDVLTNVELTGATGDNVIKNAIQDKCPYLAGNYEIIVDYKGSRRPSTSHRYWQQGEWQLQTYAWLRTRQHDALPVAAGMLIYVNELAPGVDDLTELKREIRRRETDITPVSGSRDYYELNTWQPGPQSMAPQFSRDFLFSRAIRVFPIDAKSQEGAARRFDDVVRDIEGCVSSEQKVGTIANQWTPSGDHTTCAACDFRHFCPSPSPGQGEGERKKRSPIAPPAP